MLSVTSKLFYVECRGAAIVLCYSLLVLHHQSKTLEDQMFFEPKTGRPARPTNSFIVVVQIETLVLFCVNGFLKRFVTKIFELFQKEFFFRQILFLGL
jgi:hypothetical protein